MVESGFGERLSIDVSLIACRQLKIGALLRREGGLPPPRERLSTLDRGVSRNLVEG